MAIDLFENLKKEHRKLNRNSTEYAGSLSIYDKLIPCLFLLLIFQPAFYYPIPGLIFGFSVLFLFMGYFFSIIYNMKNNHNIYYIKLYNNELHDKIINDFAIKNCINSIDNFLFNILQDKQNIREPYVKGIFFDLVDHQYFLIFGKTKEYKKTKQSQNVFLFYASDKNSLIDFFTELYKNKINLSNNNKKGIIESITCCETNFSSDQNYQWLEDFVFNYEYYAKLNYENNSLRKNNGSNKAKKNDSIL